ncbi:hypothetical protein [Kitasatospora viridis]|uniref:Secreted protein n=1 Tax=Kitasatospora viridis TaxID=281105 RepID=A0A561T786_9ACTN|nr:hypothetical protein [Kitasatospora viridis]TWF82974.1 hypothetical protein FHX73_14457 [Kitasatospora viridis]
MHRRTTHAFGTATAAFALLTLALGSTGFAPPAHAATRAPALTCGRAYDYLGDNIKVEVSIDDNCRAYDVWGIWLGNAANGHLEFWGPHGEIGNTPDSNSDQGDVRINPTQSTTDGDLWCTRFWQHNGDGGYTQLGGDTCVTL